MKVRDVMSAPAITIGPDASYAEIVHSLVANDISGLPVVDDDGQLLGMVTEADLIFKEAYGRNGGRALGVVGEIIQGHRPTWVAKVAARTARDLMSTATIVAEPDDDLAVAARRMLRRRCKRLAVVSDGRVVGVVSRQDLLRRFDRADGEISLDVARLVDPLQIPDGHDLAFSVSNGIVTLRGEVRCREHASALKDAVIRIDGVVDVDDRLVVGEPRSLL